MIYLSKKIIPYYLLSSLLTISLVVFVYIFINYQKLNNNIDNIEKTIEKTKQEDQTISEKIKKEEDYLKELEESNKAKIEEYEIWKYLKEKVTTALSS